jgi:hypothetical protein
MADRFFIASHTMGCRTACGADWFTSFSTLSEYQILYYNETWTKVRAIRRFFIMFYEMR